MTNKNTGEKTEDPIKYSGFARLLESGNIKFLHFRLKASGRQVVHSCAARKHFIIFMKKEVDKPFGENVKLTPEELEKINGGCYYSDSNTSTQ